MKGTEWGILGKTVCKIKIPVQPLSVEAMYSASSVHEHLENLGKQGTFPITGEFTLAWLNDYSEKYVTRAVFNCLRDVKKTSSTTDHTTVTNSEPGELWTPATWLDAVKIEARLRLQAFERRWLKDYGVLFLSARAWNWFMELTEPTYDLKEWHVSTTINTTINVTNSEETRICPHFTEEYENERNHLNFMTWDALDQHAAT